MAFVCSTAWWRPTTNRTAAIAEVSFYHLDSQPLDWALPRLLLRVVDSGRRALVVTGNGARLASLDQLLWTFDEVSFLAHGSAPDPDAARQPIWLTEGTDNPNGATVLVLVDGAAPADPQLAGFERCLDLFDGADERALAAARGRWSAAKAAGHSLTYWQQSPEGRWHKKA